MSNLEDTNVFNKTLSTSYMDRDSALLVYKDKLYVSDNHQLALQIAMSDNGEFLGDDKYVNDNIDELSRLTNDKSKVDELSTFGVYDSKYLVAHYKSNLDLNLNVIVNYAKDNDLIVGYYPIINSENFLLLDN